MAVPETSVYEYDGAAFREDDVRLAGQRFDVEAIAKAFCEKRLSKRDFRFRVAPFHRAHDFGTLFRRENVGARAFAAHAAFCAWTSEGSRTYSASQVYEVFKLPVRIASKG